MEADLQRVYSVDVGDVLTGALSWRRLGVLVAGLYGETARWGPAEHLLATQIDVLRAANWQRGGGKGQRPKPLPRPGRNGVRKYGTGRYSIRQMQQIMDRANREVSNGS